MLCNKIILDRQSKKLLKCTIKDVHNSKIQTTIRINFKKINNRIRYIIDQLYLLPLVLNDIICSYTNDIFQFDVLIKPDTVSLHIYGSISIYLQPINAMISNMSFDYSFSIYCYPSIKNAMYNIHSEKVPMSGTTSIFYASEHLYILEFLNDYMTLHYKKYNYYDAICIPNRNKKKVSFVVINHRLLKYLCVIIKILLQLLNEVILEYDTN